MGVVVVEAGVVGGDGVGDVVVVGCWGGCGCCCCIEGVTGLEWTRGIAMNSRLCERDTNRISGV